MNNSIWALWLTLSYEVANMYFSVGIVTALTFGVIILLRPVTNTCWSPGTGCGCGPSGGIAAIPPISGACMAE